MVERVFGHFKLRYGTNKTRHLGLMPFHINTLLASMLNNLKTALSLKKKYGLA
jgi:IS5 family transposase